MRVCVASGQHSFPDCNKGKAGTSLSVPADKGGRIVVPTLKEGDYAVAIVHDENGNGKLDTMMGIPREGFGFSRNPTIVAGPPSFSQSRFHFAAGHSGERIKMRYML